MVEIDSSTTDIDSQKARRDQLVNDFLDAKAGAEKYAIVIEQLGEQLVRELGVGGRHEVLPGVGVKVQAPSSRFNAELAQQVLTPDQFALICDPKPSVAGLKRIPGVLADQCKTADGKPSVKVL